MHIHVKETFSWQHSLKEHNVCFFQHKTAVLFHTIEDGKNVDISETIVFKEKEVDVKGSDFTMINDYEKVCLQLL